MKSKVRIYLIQVLVLLVILSVWQVIGDSNARTAFLIGTPYKIISEFYTLIVDENLLKNFISTGGEAITGLLIGTFFGSLFGLLLWYSKQVAEIARPFIIALGTLPVFAFAPLFIVWFGIGFGMKVAIAAFSTFFVAFNEANRGALSVSSDYIEALKGINASKNQIFYKVIVPGSINWVFSSMRLNVGFSLLGAFIGEFVSADKGLGFLILRAAGLYNIPRAFAAAFGITVLAILLDYAARKIEKNSNLLVQLFSVPKYLRKKTSKDKIR
jgi:NitT/TauT family transport system permease protein